MFLGLKRKNIMAWVETAHRVYVNQVIEACFHINSSGSYCAAGIMFRIIEPGTYYLVLFSSKGYFRLDAINNNIPQPLIGWTETPGMDENIPFGESGINLSIIARNNHIILLLNGDWLAEAYDDSIPGGHPGFSIVSYDAEQPGQYGKCAQEGEERYFSPAGNFVCLAALDFLSVDSRARTVEAEYQKWIDSVKISAKSRYRLAESLAAIDQCGGAYDQVLKIWKQRDEAVRGIIATYADVRARAELLFAARISQRLGNYTDAQDHIDACLAMDGDEVKGVDALTEKAKILSALHKYDEIAAYLPAYIKRVHTGAAALPPLYALLGHAYWKLQDYKNAAASWEMAFSLNDRNGLYAISAARAFEMIGKKSKALQRYIDGGNCFLQGEHYGELGALIPKITAIGKNSLEANILAEKWAFGTGDSSLAQNYRAASMRLQKLTQSGTADSQQPKPAKAPAAAKPSEKKPKAKA